MTQLLFFSIWNILQLSDNVGGRQSKIKSIPALDRAGKVHLILAFHIFFLLEECKPKHPVDICMISHPVSAKGHMTSTRV